MPPTPSPPSKFRPKLKNSVNRQGCHGKFEAARRQKNQLEDLLAAQIQAPLADGSDVTEWLPDTLLDTILLFLSIRDMNRAGRVSKRWKRMVDSPRCQNFHRTLDVRMAKYVLHPPYFGRPTSTPRLVGISSDMPLFWSSPAHRITS